MSQLTLNKGKREVSTTHIGFEPITAWLGPRYATIAPVSLFLCREGAYCRLCLDWLPDGKGTERGLTSLGKSLGKAYTVECP